MADLSEKDKEARQKLIDGFFLNPDGSSPELNPELLPYLHEDPNVGTCIKHPLVFSIAHSNTLNGVINRSFEQKKKAVVQAEQEENWSLYVFLHERPYRIGAFYGIADLLSDERYWEILSEIWTDTENMWQQAYTWKLCLESDRPGRYEHFMDDDERKVLDELPERLTIYRGSSEGLPPGLSWTLDQDRAEWFAKRYLREGRSPILFIAQVDKKNVIGYLGGRNESEIVVLHDFLEDVQRVTL